MRSSDGSVLDSLWKSLQPMVLSHSQLSDDPPADSTLFLQSLYQDVFERCIQIYFDKDTATLPQDAASYRPTVPMMMNVT